MTDTTDNELVQLLNVGDKTAFDALYRRYHVRIYANALKLLKDNLAAEDIVQEVFVALWEKRNTINSNENVAAWLFVVSYNKSVSLLKNKLKQSLAQKELLKAGLSEDDTTNNFADTRLDILQKAINQLSPQKRKVFELCKLEGKTYEQAATEMNISKHTVKEYLSGAIASIKEYIKNNPEQTSVYIIATVLQLFK